MREPISTEADKDAALAQLADFRQAKPGSAEEEAMMELVTSVADFISDRDQTGTELS